MMSYWAEFARSGEPGRGRRGELPQWTAWDPADDGDKFVVLDTESDGGVRMARDVVSNDKLLAEMRTDPRLADATQRCARARAPWSTWSPALDEGDYAAGGLRRQYPRIASGK